MQASSSGWEKNSHGLTSRLGQSASELFLNELLGLFRYPPGSGRALLAGTLPLVYCAARFACSTPTWRLPVSGHVDGLVTANVGAVRATKQKNSCTPRGVYDSISSTGLEEVPSCGAFLCFHS